MLRNIWHKYHSWYFKVVSNFTHLTAREITYKNFEIWRVLFMPNITINHAITYTNQEVFSSLNFTSIKCVREPFLVFFHRPKCLISLPFIYFTTNEIPTTSYTWSQRKRIPFLKGSYFSEVVIVEPLAELYCCTTNT